MAASTSSLSTHTPEAAAPLLEPQQASLISPESERAPGTAVIGSIRVVVQRPRKHFFLSPLNYEPLTTGRDIMKDLGEMRNQEVSRINVLKPIRQALWTPVIEIVNLSTVSDSNWPVI